MPYAAGTFDFPLSTGDFSVTGLGFQPEMVIMFGGNQATEDTLLTGLTRPGLFLSMCAVDYANPANLNVQSISIAGNAGGGGTTFGYTRTFSTTGGLPVRMQNTTGSAGIDYRASQITFDADGFTLTVSHAAPGNRPIHWWAVNSEDRGLASELALDTTGFFDTGFQIESFLGMAGPTSGNAEANTDSDSWLQFGTSHWPNNAVDLDTRFSGVTHTGINATGPGGRQGWTEAFQFSGVNAQRLVFDLGTAGPSLADGYTHAEPTVLFGTEAVISAADTDVHDQTTVVWTGIPGDARQLIGGATVGDVVSKSTPSWFDRFALVMFSTINGPIDVGAGVGSAGTLRYGLGVLHPDYQGCVAMGDDGSFYQSTTKCAANCTASGAEAVEGTILGPTFEVETVVGGAIEVTYHAFGVLKRLGMIPQIYRRVVPG